MSCVNKNMLLSSSYFQNRRKNLFLKKQWMKTFLFLRKNFIVFDSLFFEKKAREIVLQAIFSFISNIVAFIFNFLLKKEINFNLFKMCVPRNRYITNLSEFEASSPLLERDEMIVIRVTSIEEGLDAML